MSLESEREQDRLDWEIAYVYGATHISSVEELHSWGWYGRPCKCDEPWCDGFAIHQAHDEALLDDELIRDGYPPAPLFGFGGAPRNP